MAIYLKFPYINIMTVPTLLYSPCWQAINFVYIRAWLKMEFGVGFQIPQYPQMLGEGSPWLSSLRNSTTLGYGSKCRYWIYANSEVFCIRSLKCGGALPEKKRCLIKGCYVFESNWHCRVDNAIFNQFFWGKILWPQRGLRFVWEFWLQFLVHAQMFLWEPINLHQDV